MTIHEKTLKCIIVAALALTLCLGLAGCGDKEAENYVVEDGVITSYIGPGGDVTIPAKISGKKITAIGAEAFKDNMDVTGVTISDGITTIGDRAFYKCKNLVRLDLGSVESVGEDAFYACWSIVDLDIPESLTDIGYMAFSLLTLNEHEKDNGRLYFPATVKTVADSAFEGARFSTIEFESATLPAFEDGAFSNAGYVKVVLPDSVTPEEIPAYRDTLSKAGLEYSEAVTSFYNTKGEELVIVYEDYSALFTYNDEEGWITGYIGDEPNVTIPAEINGYPVTEISSQAFMNNAVLENVTVSPGIPKISGSAFDNCPNLKSVVIGEGTETIGSSAFYGCAALESVRLPDSLTALGESTFNSCSSLREVKLGASLGEIKYGTFLDCTSLESIELPKNLKTLGDSAFYGCSALTDINMENLSRLGSGCMEYTAITEVTIPGTVKEIPENCFVGCYYLVDITLEEGVERIGPSAFTWCGLDPEKRGGTIATGCDEPGVRPNEETGDDLLPFINLHFPKTLKFVGDFILEGCWVNSIEFMTVETPDDLPEFDPNAFSGMKYIAWVYFTEEAIEAHGVEFDELLMSLNNMDDRAWYHMGRDAYWASEPSN